jgi:hypothetical protein
VIEWSDYNQDRRCCSTTPVAELPRLGERTPRAGNIEPARRVARMPHHDVFGGKRRCKVANTPNQQNQKNPQADRDEEQRRQQEQQGGQNRQPGSNQRPDADRQNPQQR